MVDCLFTINSNLPLFFLFWSYYLNLYVFADVCRNVQRFHYTDSNFASCPQAQGDNPSRAVNLLFSHTSFTVVYISLGFTGMYNYLSLRSSVSVFYYSIRKCHGAIYVVHEYARWCTTLIFLVYQE